QELDRPRAQAGYQSAAHDPAGLRIRSRRVRRSDIGADRPGCSAAGCPPGTGGPVAVAWRRPPPAQRTRPVSAPSGWSHGSRETKELTMTAQNVMSAKQIVLTDADFDRLTVLVESPKYRASHAVLVASLREELENAKVVESGKVPRG